ncbi:OPT-domain-containing protein [Hyphopichia burtonii NRRL Y-1933]|uniref:OPT-domain-containing protein n=1 Tax=Hyphopichia burtonii NRRL Y-1933 TaxID=984485 RepID=A0A1E4RGG0_9ASCO|nr:OPT-domain-containing protein [Hyphopichia burtonii NRRL Y-1933]ODV66349.1 OPT-domain-containing protein [Hyphopichia burtonii NRRL Y-1933]
MAEKANVNKEIANLDKENAITSVTSVRSHLDVEDHQLDLNAITSQPLSIGQVAEELTSDQKFFILKRLNYEGLVSFDNLPTGAAFMLEKVQALDINEAVTILKEFLVEHEGDVNLPTQDYELIEKLVANAPSNLYNSNSSSENIKEKLADNFEKQTSITSSTDIESTEIVDWFLQTKLEAALIAYHSPYAEVRAVTDCFDDPELSCETIRVYIVGLVMTAIGAFINQFFAERQPSVTFSSSVAQLFIYPFGTALSYILPDWNLKVWKYNFRLNPGPWTHKEQMLATIFFSVSGGGTSYVSYNIHVQKLARYYDNQWADFGYQTLLILATNFLGFGFAGIMRKFAIYPIKSIWPTILPTLALNKALTQPERKENINGWTISRYYWFFLVTVVSFVYFWIPDYLFQALSTFNWITWIKPDNFNLAMVTGSVKGLGLNPIPTFDWNVINYNHCLTFPFYSYANQYIGTFLGLFIITGLYYSNHLWTGYMPINSSSLFTNTGELYDVKAIVNSNSLFDRNKYEKVGPPFYSAANLVVYGSFFAIYPFTIVYEVFMNYKPMKDALFGLGKSFRNFRRSTYHGFTDPHSRMMTRYKEVPDWCFLCVLVISVVLGILCVKVYPAETPVWGIFFALAINFVFLIPLTAVYSVTGFQFGLNVLVELIVGYALPGNGLALNFIKALGYNINGQAQNYISDQKMGHYLKIPPRAMFRTQMLSVFLTSFIGLAVINFDINHIKDYCDPDNRLKFTCPNSNVFYSASILWGVIGPKIVFGGIYPILQYCFLIGLLLAFPCIAFKKYGPKKVAKYFQPTLIIGGLLNYAPYNLSYYTVGLYFSIASMWYLRKRYTTWWEKYNYVFTAAMDAGVAFSAIIIFFAVQYHDKSINWWGNLVSYLGYDGVGGNRLNATLSAPDGYFGPRKGHYP